MTLQDMNITRSIRPKNFGEVIHCSLHYFSDPCETGYALSGYIRLANAEGAVNSPCYLELHQAGLCSSLDLLTAPTISVKVSKMIREETAALINDEIFWTDSQVVLGYIKCEISVDNRVQ